MAITLINAVEFRQVVDLLDEVASPAVVNRALAASDISRRLLCETQGFIPYRLEASVVEHVARSIGDPYLGARAATQFEYTAYAAYARYVMGARTLGAALIRGCETFELIQPGGKITLERRPDHLLVGRVSNLGSMVGHHHLDDGALFIVIHLIRYFLGPGWHPDWVETTGRAGARTRYLEDTIGAPVHGAAGVPSVAVRTGDLAAPNPCLPGAQDAVTLSDLPVLMGVDPPRTTAETVEQVIQTQIALGHASEDDVASYMSVGPRTLQRALQSEGTSFREIKARIIERRASALLAETDLDVATIASSLGYNEPKSFQRAFRKRTGLWPSAYRAARRRG